MTQHNRRSGQALIEYFLLFFVFASLTLIALRTFTVNEVTGEQEKNPMNVRARLQEYVRDASNRLAREVP